MARKDRILKSFLSHELLKEKYGLSDEQIDLNVREAMQSDIPIINTIATIVNQLESHGTITDSALRNMITQYLNTKVI